MTEFEMTVYPRFLTTFEMTVCPRFLTPPDGGVRNDRWFVRNDKG